MEVKVGDFGLATKMVNETDKRKTICGTPNYIAPEVLDGKTGYSYEVDMWSFGIVVYTLLVGEPPFDSETEKMTYKLIKANSYSFPKHIEISEDAKDLITKLLNPNPTTRLTLAQTYSHQFLRNRDSIPKLMPTFTLSSAPSRSYIKEVVYSSQSSVNTSIEKVTLEKPKLTITDNEPNVLQNDWTSNSNEKTVDSPKSRHAVFVKKWIDYSSKYGLGYLLSNECIGVFFNDSTKIILSPEKQLSYIDRIKTNKQETILTCTLDEYPEELRKKVSILKYFKEKLEENDRRVVRSPNKLPLGKEGGLGEMIYVKKWISNGQTIMFRLSNKIIQVDFQDNTEVIMNPEVHEVAYVNKNGERFVHSSATALKSDNKEMIKRLEYTQEILHKLTLKDKFKENCC